jgi:hypothetical protein
MMTCPVSGCPMVPSEGTGTGTGTGVGTGVGFGGGTGVGAGDLHVAMQSPGDSEPLGSSLHWPDVVSQLYMAGVGAGGAGVGTGVGTGAGVGAGGVGGGGDGVVQTRTPDHNSEYRLQISPPMAFTLKKLSGSAVWQASYHQCATRIDEG